MKSLRKIDDLRSRMQEEVLLEKNLPPSPLLLFDRWMKKAIDSKNPEPNAMTLATSEKKGKPSARIVLLKGFNKNGFVFYTNYRSRKGNDLGKNNFAGKKIPRPENWGGYRLVPDYFEFWQGRHNRLHDRIVYKKISSKKWKTFRLYP